MLATAIPLREKRGGEGDGEWRNGRENGESGKEVAVMQLVRQIEILDRVVFGMSRGDA